MERHNLTRTNVPRTAAKAPITSEFFGELRAPTTAWLEVRVLPTPPRIPTPEKISRPSGNYRPISRLVWRELRLRQGLCELLGDVSSPSSLRTKIGFPETETPVRRDAVRMQVN